MLYEKRLHKFTGKHLCQGLFFNKFAGLRAATLVKKKLSDMYFPVNFFEIPKNTLFIEHLWITAFDFVCGVFFIFSIIKNFRHEKRRFVRKKSTSGNRLYWKKILNASFIEYRVTIFTWFVIWEWKTKTFSHDFLLKCSTEEPFSSLFVDHPVYSPV